MRDCAVEEEVNAVQEVRGSKPFTGGEITYFSGELWSIFVRSPLTLALNLPNFSAFTAFLRKIMYEICGEKTNFSPLILHTFAIFSRPGWNWNNRTFKACNWAVHLFLCFKFELWPLKFVQWLLKRFILQLYGTRYGKKEIQWIFIEQWWS